jgi:hypothetical protein
MVLENLAVKHKAFGLGEIVSVQGKYITVKFDTANKVFVYPDIFEKFLTLADGTVSDEIYADLKVSNDAKLHIQNMKNAENERAREKGIVIPGKEIVPGESDDEEIRKNSEVEEI